MVLFPCNCSMAFLMIFIFDVGTASVKEHQAAVGNQNDRVWCVFPLSRTQVELEQLRASTNQRLNKTQGRRRRIGNDTRRYIKRSEENKKETKKGRQSVDNWGEWGENGSGTISEDDRVVLIPNGPNWTRMDLQQCQRADNGSE